MSGRRRGPKAKPAAPLEVSPAQAALVASAAANEARLPPPPRPPPLSGPVPAALAGELRLGQELQLDEGSKLEFKVPRGLAASL
jgi:hypothetical protein